MECPQEMIFLNSMVEKSFHVSVSETVLDEGRNISDKWLAADKRLEAKKTTKLLYRFLTNPCDYMV